MMMSLCLHCGAESTVYPLPGHEMGVCPQRSTEPCPTCGEAPGFPCRILHPSPNAGKVTRRHAARTSPDGPIDVLGAPPALPEGVADLGAYRRARGI